MYVAAPGGRRVGQPACVEFVRQNPAFLAVWDEIEGDYQRTIEDRFSSGQAPDVFQVREGHLGAWANAGMITGLGRTGVFEQLRNTMFDGAVAGTFHPGGQAAGIPHYHDVMLLAYNRRHLDLLGGSPPSSLDELASFAVELQTQFGIRTPIALNFSPKANANLPWWGLLRASAASLIDQDGADSQMAVNVLAWLRARLVEDATLDGDFATRGYDLIGRGEHSFAIVGSYMAKILASDQFEPVGFAALPGIDRPGAGTVCWTPLFAVAQQNQVNPAAAPLALHLGASDSTGNLWGPRHFAVVGGLPPAHPSLLRDPTVGATFAQHMDLSMLSNQLAVARPVDSLWERWFGAWEHRCQDELIDALWGRQSAAQAIDNMRRSAADLAKTSTNRPQLAAANTT